jgi:hypothetical protein
LRSRPIGNPRKIVDPAIAPSNKIRLVDMERVPLDGGLPPAARGRI